MPQPLVAKECVGVHLLQLLSMQALGASANNLSLNTLLGQCWLEQAADCKLEAIGGTIGRAKVN